MAGGPLNFSRFPTDYFRFHPITAERLVERPKIWYKRWYYNYKNRARSWHWSNKPFRNGNGFKISRSFQFPKIMTGLSYELIRKCAYKFWIWAVSRHLRPNTMLKRATVMYINWKEYYQDKVRIWDKSVQPFTNGSHLKYGRFLDFTLSRFCI